MNALPSIALALMLLLVTVAPQFDAVDPPGHAERRAALERAERAGFNLVARASASATGAAGSDTPFEITEIRERCDHYDPNRLPFFGTTHLHTGLSFDASIRFVDYASGNNPRGAYRFAKGLSSIQLPDPLGFQGPDPLRNPRIDRPTDWGAVTDHSEHFGEMGICKNFLGRDAPGVTSMECRMLNGFFYQPGTSPSSGLNRSLASNAFAQLTMMNLGTSSRNTRLPLCVNNPTECAAAELAVWQEMQMAAEEEYDRSRNCTFTTFIGYENTSTPTGDQLAPQRHLPQRPRGEAAHQRHRHGRADQPLADPRGAGWRGGAPDLDRRLCAARPRRVSGSSRHLRHLPAPPALLEQARARLHLRRQRHRRHRAALRLHHHSPQQ
jgi:hypothetical protein